MEIESRLRMFFKILFIYKNKKLYYFNGFLNKKYFKKQSQLLFQAPSNQKHSSEIIFIKLGLP